MSHRTRRPGTTSSGEFVFAYGSNMVPADFIRWCHAKGVCPGSAMPLAVGYLDGFGLAWNYHSKAREGGAANVEPLPNLPLGTPPAWGVVFRGNSKHLMALDRKEGHPKVYQRERLRVFTRDRNQMWAWVYRVAREFRQERVVPPRYPYLQLLERGASEFCLPGSYRDWLSATAFVGPKTT